MTTLTVIVLLLGAAGCTDLDHYPISGQECSADDPVLDLDANDCAPLV
ncbi:hypothetical protein [Sulfitobacter marinus]|nr:hypothetical protein [Sulfitobacter marinus]